MNSGFRWSVVTRTVSFCQLDVVRAVGAPPEGALVTISPHYKHSAVAEPGHHLVQLHVRDVSVKQKKSHLKFVCVL